MNTALYFLFRYSFSFTELPPPPIVGFVFGNNLIFIARDPGRHFYGFTTDTSGNER